MQLTWQQGEASAVQLTGKCRSSRQGIGQNSFDAQLSELAKTKPKLENFSWSRSLQAHLPAMVFTGRSFHVWKSGAERCAELMPITKQEQR